MRSALILLLLLCAVVAAVIFFFNRRRRTRSGEPAERIRIGDVELVPESVSRQRAESLLPSRGSQDMAHLLHVPRIEPVEPTADEVEGSYPPDDELDWTVEVHLPDGYLVSRDDVMNVFDSSWAKSIGGAMLLGFCPDKNVWTYVVAADAPEPYSVIGLAKSLLDGDDTSPEALTAMRRSVEEVSKVWPDAKVMARDTPEEGYVKSQRLKALESKLSLDAIIIVSARDVPFEGRKIWDAMYSLGLTWADMDLFHWRNPNKVGDSYFFSVWTSTPPGYFLPELIAAGQVHVNDLVFGFSIPRSAAPADVYEQMIVAARYARSRLGGQLLGADGGPLDQQATRQVIAGVIEELRLAGLAPGQHRTLRIF